MLRSHAVFLGSLFCVCCLLSGCGPAQPQSFVISGDITYDGEPIKKCTITFVSQDPAIVDDSATTDDAGHYEARVKAGKKKVVIYATREEGEVDPAMGARQQVPYLPPEYSTEVMTKLTLDVAADGKHDFHLLKP